MVAVVVLNIKNPEVDRLTRELGGLTGESITQAVKTAVEEWLRRVKSAETDPTLLDDLMEIARRCTALPVYDDRTADEILGYDENGLPS